MPKGAGLAALGAIAAYLSSEVVPDLEKGGTALLAAVFAVIANLLRKLAADNSGRPKFMLLALVLAVGLPVGTTFAQQTEPVRALKLNSLPPGQYVLTIDSQGNPTVVPLVLIELDGSSPPPPVDPPPPPPQGGLEGRVSQLAAQHQLDKSIAAELAGVYEAASQQSGGSLQDVFAAVRQTADALLSVRGAQQAFQPFRDALTAEVQPHLSAGTFTTAAFGEIAAGIRQYSGNQAIDVLDIVRVFTIVLEKITSGEKFTVEDAIRIMQILLSSNDPPANPGPALARRRTSLALN